MNKRPRCNECESILNTSYIFKKINHKSIKKWIKIGFYCFNCKLFFPEKSVTIN